MPTPRSIFRGSGTIGEFSDTYTAYEKTVRKAMSRFDGRPSKRNQCELDRIRNRD
jgi:hypothetical protein